MRLSVITDEISQDLDHALSVMAEYGCRDAELRNVYGTYIIDASEAELAQVETALQRHQMQVCCLDTPLFKCELEPEKSAAFAAAASGATHNATERSLSDQMHLLETAISLCRRFDTPFIRIFSFWKRGALTPEIEERIVTALMPAVQVAERAGVTLLLENEHACYLATGAETARVVEKISSPALRMVWDPGNAFMAGENPFPSGWEACAAHVAHVHLKDGRADASGNLSWTVIGDGEIDYPGQLRALENAGYTGVVALETHYKAPDGSAEEASRQCLEALRHLIVSL